MTRVGLEILEFLCSKLCHDLVGPVGAINNGVELLADPGLAADEDILPLIEGSALSARHRLDFYRIAFGFGGGRSGWRIADLRPLLANLLAEGKVELDWAPGPDGDAEEVSSRVAKLLLNLGSLAAEALPRGGRLSIALGFDAEALAGSIEATGAGAAMRTEAAAALRGETAPEAIDARCVQAHLASVLAGDVDATLNISCGNDRVDFAFRVPSARPPDFIGR